MSLPRFLDTPSSPRTPPPLRTFLCEAQFPSRCLVTPFPEVSTPLPSEAADLDRPTGRDRPAVGTIPRCPGVGRFGRQAHAALLLDRVWAITRLTTADAAGRAAVSQTDRDLWSFVSLLTEQRDGVRGVYCGVLAVVLR